MLHTAAACLSAGQLQQAPVLLLQAHVAQAAGWKHPAAAVLQAISSCSCPAGQLQGHHAAVVVAAAGWLQQAAITAPPPYFCLL
jgi:hypothetical protein